MAPNLNTPVVAAAFIALFCSLVFCLGVTGCLGAEKLGVGSGTVQSEPWRLGTHMFVHLGVGHLLITLAGLVLAGVLAWEFEMRGSTFLAVFAGVGILAVLPAVFFFDSYTFVGASAGVIGLFGYVSVEFGKYEFPSSYARKILKVLPVFLVLALAVPLIVEVGYARSAVVAVGAVVHVFALAFGVGLGFMRL